MMRRDGCRGNGKNHNTKESAVTLWVHDWTLSLHSHETRRTKDVQQLYAHVFPVYYQTQGEDTRQTGTHVEDVRIHTCVYVSRPHVFDKGRVIVSTRADTGFSSKASVGCRCSFKKISHGSGFRRTCQAYRYNGIFDGHARHQRSQKDQFQSVEVCCGSVPREKLCLIFVPPSAISPLADTSGPVAALVPHKAVTGPRRFNADTLCGALHILPSTGLYFRHGHLSVRCAVLLSEREDRGGG